MIAALLDEEQLPALRLVSKQVCHSFSDVFAKVKFAYLHHQITEPSLKKLIKITSHAVFSRHVKCIEFSTTRTESSSQGIPNPICEEDSEADSEEDSESRKSERHITMLVTALESLKHHGNHCVSLGVFDSLYSINLLRAINDIPTRRTTLGHGYVKSFDARSMAFNPHQIMFAVREAAKLSKYSSQQLSYTTAFNPLIETNFITDDQADAFLDKRSHQFKSNLMLRFIALRMVKSNLSQLRDLEAPFLTVEVKTGASSHLSLQGQNIALDDWIFERAAHTAKLLHDSTSIFFNNSYQTLILKDLQLKSQGLSSLCSRTMQQTFECLEMSNVDFWISKDVNDLGPITFLTHFKNISSIKKLKISDLIVNANFYLNHETVQPLRLAADEIVAEGHDQVQRVFDVLIAQILTWREHRRAQWLHQWGY